MDKLQLRDLILEKIELPRIPDKNYSVLDFGVVPDSDRVQTSCIQAAIDEASQAGGGRVNVPAGRYRTGALQLKNGVELHLESRDTILAFETEEPWIHYPLVFCHWEASPCYNFSPFIYACDAHDIALTGEGTLDGGADREHWWNWHHQVENAWSSNKKDMQKEDRGLLRRMNQSGVPVKERVFGQGHYLRPNFVQPIRCRRLLLQGFTLKNSPMWQLNPVMCESMTIDGLTLSSHGANNDGCDPESCRGVHIKNCRFDTGDDCISLKSGRDRDGREANMPCEYILIEDNEFADGHGGVALGSEMSGGIRCVLAWHNHFSSPNLTYALRLKTNAKRGGNVEDIILSDSVMEHVHGAAVHGTMLYEDGRNGDNLPTFCNIAIENIKAHGGDYGIFLEVFDEVPITGLVLKNIEIDGVDRPMRAMNWKKPVVEQVTINGKTFPRPGNVRILGIPLSGGNVTAAADFLGGLGECRFFWEVSRDKECWEPLGEGPAVTVPGEGLWLRVIAGDSQETGEPETWKTAEVSYPYRIIRQEEPENELEALRLRLLCRNMLSENEQLDDGPVTRERLARMMAPLLGKEKGNDEDSSFLTTAIRQEFLALDEGGSENPEGGITRQKMATVAMQACGVNYRNASSTMPVCRDVDQVNDNYGTNVARALYFGFMELEQDGNFYPLRHVTVKEAARILNRTADFAGL